MPACGVPCSDSVGPHIATYQWIDAARHPILIHGLTRGHEPDSSTDQLIWDTAAALLQRSRLPKLRLEQQSSTSVQRLPPTRSWADLKHVMPETVHTAGSFSLLEPRKRPQDGTPWVSIIDAHPSMRAAECRSRLDGTPSLHETSLVRQSKFQNTFEFS